MNRVASPARPDLATTPRPASVAGTFYPAEPETLEAMVEDLLAGAARLAALDAPAPPPLGLPLGLLVPHAGLEYSGLVAAAGWRCLLPPDDGSLTVVVLGTNHRAAWLDGIGAWPGGAWRTPSGDVEVDAALADVILDLGSPFFVDREAHVGEHSIEVQLPLLRAVAPDARIVPLAVSTGSGPEAVEAGERLGARLSEHRRAGARIVLAISTDAAHYPAERDCRRVTAALLPGILALDAKGVAAGERALVRAGTPGLVCGMCGIAPTVVGLAALRAMGATTATALASATSADAGAPPDRTVGYLAVRFDG
jgi:MEMO1 family protein